MSAIVLILDLDGVLITSPPWRADEIEDDGYSKFNESCVENLNSLISFASFEIWLSSSRRKTKVLNEFNQIFENRGINQSIEGFVPLCQDCSCRKEEIEVFIKSQKLERYIIIDDDKSLHELSQKMKRKLVVTNLMRGFTSEKLSESLAIAKNL